MNKRIPHYRLSDIKALIEQGKVRLTKSALECGASLGFDLNEILRVIMR